MQDIRKGLGIGVATLSRWLNDFGARCKSPLAISLDLKPSWSGLLGIDAKPIKIGGSKNTVLLATDISTLDVLHMMMAKGESEAKFEPLLRDVKEQLQYPFQAVVSDLGKGTILPGLVGELLPDVPHQICVVHFLRYMNQFVPRSRRSPYYWQDKYLREAVKAILFSETLLEVYERLTWLLKDRELFNGSYQKRIIRSLEKHFWLLTTHLNHLEWLPRDNNVAENIIGQLNQKLTQIRGFKSPISAIAFMKLWFAWYRFKPLSSSNYPYQIRKAPLELAGINLSKIDWLDYAIS